jgi:hypothetical protein
MNLLKRFCVKANIAMGMQCGIVGFQIRECDGVITALGGVI